MVKRLLILEEERVLAVVTCPFSTVNVVCEVFFSVSDCEFVEPQTLLSLSRNREASFVDSQEKMNFDRALVKAPLAITRKATTPQQSPPPPAANLANVARSAAGITSRRNDDGGG